MILYQSWNESNFYKWTDGSVKNSRLRVVSEGLLPDQDEFDLWCSAFYYGWRILVAPAVQHLVVYLMEAQKKKNQTKPWFVIENSKIMFIL